MSKNTVDIANALLAENAALEARVKELEAELERLKAQQEAKNGVKVGDTYLTPGGFYFTVASLNDVMATATNGERLRCWFLKHKCDKQAFEPRPAVAVPVVIRPGTKCIGWVKEAIHEHDEQWIAAIKAAGAEVKS